MTSFAFIYDNPEFMEIARRAVEDELVEWRDSGLFALGRNNGLTIKYPDGTPGIIRFGFEDGLRVALKALEGQTP